MLMLFKIAMTISIVWFVASLVGRSLRFKREETKFPDGLSLILTAALVGYVWDVGQLVYFADALHLSGCGTISSLCCRVRVVPVAGQAMRPLFHPLLSAFGFTAATAWR